jgi:hypothetical protein
MNKHLIALAAALTLGFAGHALAADAMDQAAYKSAKDQIEQVAKADKKACEPLKANAKDVCQAEAKGKEKVAKAELDAKNRPGAPADQKVRLMKSEAAYELAKEKCEDQKGKAMAACKKDAKVAHDKVKAEVRAEARSAARTDAKKSTKS